MRRQHLTAMPRKVDYLLSSGKQESNDSLAICWNLALWTCCSHIRQHVPRSKREQESSGQWFDGASWVGSTEAGVRGKVAGQSKVGGMRHVFEDTSCALQG
uniref:Uncharacterized protein n=1 Tax=Rhodosorus marinus TaxID=101924 RepID=A0A7S3A5R0_9RHOD|mmetsp:Transcript_45751/g.178075  ORF Transcript_45751/g.178075 Transcript_45751/m.178075 type:complete len:101 (+) Transcript_45751:114-416(+)